MQTFLAILLAIITLLMVSIERTYLNLPHKELKRRAREKDEFAAALYRAASYGFSLRILLWVLIGLAASGFFVVVSRTAPAWMALTACASIIWVSFVWMPNREARALGRWAAARLAPALSWLLYYTHPVINKTVQLVRNYATIPMNTGLYDKNDVIELLEAQKVQPGNRVSPAELTMSINALTFGDKTVRDILVPRRSVKLVKAEEAIGPILMSELHDSGHSCFPVYEGKEDDLVGTLYLNDLLDIKEGGQVKEVMRNELSTISENATLGEALLTVVHTHHYLLAVLNDREELLGIVTTTDLFDQIIGHPEEPEEVESEAEEAEIEEAEDINNEDKENTDTKEDIDN